MLVYELVETLKQLDQQGEVFVVPRTLEDLSREAYVACDVFEIRGAEDAYINGVYIQADC